MGPDAAPDLWNRRHALIISTLSGFLTPVLGSSVNIALASIQQELSIDAVLLSWIPTAFLLACAVALVPMGKLADILGRKKVFALGTTIFTIASVFCGVSRTAPWLVAFRAVQGVGSAMVFSTGVAILASVFPQQERGRAMGLNVAAVYCGLSLGPFLGGVLTEQVGWRSVFFFPVPLGVASVYFSLRLRGEWAEAKGEPFDLVGSIIYTLAIVAVMFGLSSLPGALGAGLLSLGGIGVMGFVMWEQRTRHPVLEMTLFKDNTVFAFSSLAALIHYSATFAVSFLLSLYLQYVKGLDPQSAGLVLVSQPVVMALISPLAGRISDRIEPRGVASSGMALTAMGLGLMVFLKPETTTTFVVGTLVLLGLGFALFSSPNMNAIMGSVEKRLYGAASGTLGTMRLLGQMFSMGIAALTFSMYIGRVQIGPQHFPAFMQGTRTAFVVFTLLCSIGVWASLKRGRLRDSK
ncbi:MAG: MFS transporter [Thermodesulfobacteriota bacterium]